MPPNRVLIAGAGVAGPALALLLTRNNFICTIVERAPALRATGQQIDVAGVGNQVIDFLGIGDFMRSHSVGDKGIKCVDSKDRSWGGFGIDKTTALVREIEILRGDVARVLYERTRGSTEYIFDDFITALVDHASSGTVTASFDKGPDREFDLVVGADGQGSKTRSLVFPKDAIAFRSLGAFVAYLPVAYEPSDGEWSRWYNAPGGLNLSIRPQPRTKRSSAYMVVVGHPEYNYIARLPLAEQKVELHKIFGGAGWEAERLLREVDESTELYCQEVLQVKMPSFVKGRIALLGDAGYCPSPMSGQGTTLAFTGAYMLAGCLASDPDNIPRALKRYESEMRPHIKQGQDLPPGTPWIVNPQTKWGIYVAYSLCWLVATLVNSRAAPFLAKLKAPIDPWFSERKLKLPKFEAMK